MLATYQAVFEEVHLVAVENRFQRIVIGSRIGGLDRDQLVAAADSLEVRTDLGFDLATLVEGGYEGRANSRAEVLVDPR
jgi:hypothetical protein